MSGFFNKNGFTLVELLVVVAIISILASVAVPNFVKFLSRAKQSEAKINLKAAYTAAKATFGVTNDYSKIYLIGKSASDPGIVAPFQPEKNTIYRYRGNLLSTLSPSGDWLDCTKSNCWPATYDFRGCNYTCLNSTMTTFVYKAYGQIDRDPTIDVWSIDSNNLLVNAGMTSVGTYPNNNREACSDVIY